CLCGELLALAPLLHLCYRKENRQAYQLERAFGCTTHPLLLSHSLSLSLCLSPLSPPSLSLSLPLPLSALPSISLSSLLSPLSLPVSLVCRSVSMIDVRCDDDVFLNPHSQVRHELM